MNEKIENNIRISKNFLLKEFQSPDTKEVIIIPKVLYALQNTRNDIGRAILITSGYRTKRHNLFVQGKATSDHLRGYAIDISTVNHNVSELKRALKKNGFKKIIYYRKRKFMHCAV